MVKATKENMDTIQRMNQYATVDDVNMVFMTTPEIAKEAFSRHVNALATGSDEQVAKTKTDLAYHLAEMQVMLDKTADFFGIAEDEVGTYIQHIIDEHRALLDASAKASASAV